MMDYAGLRAEQKELRERGIHRGIGFATLHRSDQSVGRVLRRRRRADLLAGWRDGAARCTGAVFVHTGVTEQGQGAEAVLAQCVATSFGVPIESVRVITGDTDNTPYGGGTWASRAAGIGGEAAWQAGKALRANVLAAAGAMLQADPTTSTYAAASSSTGQRPRAPAARGGGARRLFPARHAAARLPGRISGHAPLCPARLAVRFHQRRAGSYLEVDLTPA